MMTPFKAQELPLPEAELDVRNILGVLGRANRNLARLNGIIHVLPNPDLLISPLTTREAVFSSKIEGTQATLEDVLRFEALGDEQQADDQKSHPHREDIREVLNYRMALREAEKGIRDKPFSLNLLRRLHEILLDSVRGQNKRRGQIRTTQNWIGSTDREIENARFIPPVPEDVMPLLSNWEKYYHAEDENCDPLIKLAILHAQFEIIHPFLDGNGRIGRIIIPIFLYEKELLQRPSFYLSSYLDENRERYIELLRTLGKESKAWERWVVFFLEAIEIESKRNADTAQAILELYNKTKKRVTGLLRSSGIIHLLDAIFQKPIFTINSFSEMPSFGGYPQIRRMIKSLADNKILTILEEASGRRPQILTLAELVNICEGKEIIKPASSA